MNIESDFFGFSTLENKALYMKEDFLHYLWKYQLFDLSKNQDYYKEDIQVISAGLHNQDEGPDFLNSQIRIDGQLWVGNVEIHIKSSDWYLHQHENDSNYDAVILHVVWEDDVEVFMRNDQPLPTLELKEIVDESLLEKYKKLTKTKNLWIPCEKQFRKVDEFLVGNWLERLYIERLERKSVWIEDLLRQYKNDWEAVLFLLLAKNFGLNKNGEAFLQMARKTPFSILRKERGESMQLSALLFGQSGFLKEEIEESYYQDLKSRYQYLCHKYRLTPITQNQFHFFRMRPANFPTIRIAQLSALYVKHENLFSKLMHANRVEEFYDLFNITIDEFWKTHYTFSKESKKSLKKLTKSFIDLVLINTIIPLQFAYQKAQNILDEEKLIDLLIQLKPEKNRIIAKFLEMKIQARNAFETQALLELKNNYCAKKRCLQCAIGNQLLRQ